MEPTKYFAELKNNIRQIDTEMLDNNLDIIDKMIEDANSIGQTTLLDRLVFTREVIEKEQMALASGIDKYVHRDDVLKFIENVQPKNSVKIIELERFPRMIPEANVEHITLAKKLNVFTKFMVVFTDFTDQDYRTDEEKKIIERNRDPIVFASFTEEQPRMIHDRLYFITDWEDEFCDLTFVRMVDKMVQLGIKDPVKPIRADREYITQIVAQFKQQKIDQRERNQPAQLALNYQSQNSNGKHSFFKRVISKVWNR